MADVNALPTEVLHGIVSYLSPEFTDLRNCSLVCRALWEVATVVLYTHIDLTFEERRYEADEKTQRRQLRLIRSLAENPKLGALVRSVKNHGMYSFRDFQDATQDDDTQIIIGAAQNMKYLSNASLTPNPLAAHIIANLQLYPQLVNLHIYGLAPRQHIWSNAPASLTRLKWEIPAGRVREDPWDRAQFLVNVVEGTCPGLESLDISLADLRHGQPMLSAAPPERAQLYRDVQPTTTAKLTQLRHFGFSYMYSEIFIEEAFLSFVERHRQSLRSISIPVSYVPYKRENWDFVLKVCRLLPDLKELSLVKTMSEGSGQDITCLDFFRELTTVLATPKVSIERFSVGDMGASFSPSIGTLFGAWTSLKSLRVGDKDNKASRWGDDGRLDFHGYKDDIIKFINNLPPSLEELYLEINGEGLCCDEDEDFDPVCNLGTQIFTTLRHLHTCDIHAWISDIDGGLGKIPEKGVFYRRLAHQGSKVKDVWTSRMDCIYQDHDITVTTECVEVELEDDEGEFEGRDAEEVWLDGYEFVKVRRPTMRGRPRSERDYSWPFWQDRVRNYAGFRKRH